MASIHREIVIAAAPEAVWDALRDIGAVHRRLAPGFVTDVRLEEGSRVVTFGNGLVARELIVDVDDQARRLVWSVVGGRLTHHNASAQVFAREDGRSYFCNCYGTVGLEYARRSRFVWIADLLPDEMAPTIAQMIEQGLSVIKRTLESGGAPSDQA